MGVTSSATADRKRTERRARGAPDQCKHFGVLASLVHDDRACRLPCYEWRRLVVVVININIVVSTINGAIVVDAVLYHAGTGCLHSGLHSGHRGSGSRDGNGSQDDRG
jgi:hypothetical protein